MKAIYCQPCSGHGLEPVVFKQIGIEGITEKACQYLGITPSTFFRGGRTRGYVEKRYMVMSFLSINMNLKLVEIGKFFDKDHTTVIHGKKVVSDLCATDNRFREQYNSLTNYLNSFL